MSKGSTASSKIVVLAAGGTGGHIFPAESLADELLQRGYTPVLVTDQRFGGYFANGYKGTLGQIEVHTIRAGTVAGGLFKKIKGMGDIAIGIAQAGSLLKQIKPLAVIGFGGYPSFPTVLAASRAGIPSLIHEQNSVLGRANRILAARVSAIATSFETTTHIDPALLSRVKFTGNPVRTPIRALHDIPYPELTQDGTMRVLVIGGSQGASVFSQVVPQAIAMLPAQARARLRVDQQCREADLESTRHAYAELKVSADLATFFADVPARLASAHLVITRSGASTVSELTVAGRPAILVPLPTAMDDHQTHNANAIEDAGGGWLIPQDGFTPSSLSARIESFLNLPQSLSRAAENARSIGRIHAVKELADMVLDVASGKHSASVNEQHAAPASPAILRTDAA